MCASANCLPAAKRRREAKTPRRALSGPSLAFRAYLQQVLGLQQLFPQPLLQPQLLLQPQELTVLQQLPPELLLSQSITGGKIGSPKNSSHTFSANSSQGGIWQKP